MAVEWGTGPMSEYKTIGLVVLPDYNKIGDLYRKIKSLKKDVYEDNERIIFCYNPASEKILDTVKELLDFVDIPDFFVLFEPIDSLPLAELDFVPKKSHCIYPWINLQINNQGKVNACCLYKNIHGDVSLQKLTEIYNSKPVINLRNEFRNGQYPSGCSSCWNAESLGLPSVRQLGKVKFKEIWYNIDYTQDDYNNLQVLDLKLGNECNLSCRICNEKNSSKIADFKVKHNFINKQQFDLIKDLSKWSEQDEFYQQLELLAKNLRYLDIYGGEPLMVRRHFNFLRRLIELDVAKNIKIDYNSNGTIYSEMFFDIWQHFKEVKISFSIDDIGNRFELQRNNASWDQVEKNIKKYILKKSDQFLVDVFPTVSIMNIYYLPELLNWIDQQDFSQGPTLNVLEHPNFLSIKKLTRLARELVLEKFKNHNSHKLISNLIVGFEQLTAVESNLEFINYTKHIDQFENQNFGSTHPEIAKAMGYI